MMRAYIVGVRANSDRYSDSIWVQKENATRRTLQLTNEFARRGMSTTFWFATITECEISDADIKLPKKPK